MDIESLPVLDAVPDFTDDPESTARRGVDMVSVSPARRVAAYRGKRVLESFRHKFSFTSRDEIAAFEAFFEGRSGRWKTFWLPGWRMDLALISDVQIGHTQMFIAPINYKTLYGPFPSADTKQLGRRLYVFTTDMASVFAPRVDAALNHAPADDALQLDAASPALFPVLSTVVTFLHHVRFVEDDLLMTYSAPGSATCDVGFVEVATSDVEADA